jgi:molybdate transport system permease protein
VNQGQSRFPLFLWVPAGVAVTLLTLPLVAILLRINWSEVPQTILAPEALAALQLSLLTATVATLLCIVLGVPLALLLVRLRGVAATTIRALVMLPLVLPPLVGGMALLLLLGRNGLLGDLLGSIGLRVPFTTAAVVIAQTFVALPFLVISVEGALRSSDTSLERVAESLGAGPAMILRRVTLPLIAPALFSGIILSFTRALGEFGATAMFAGNAAGTTQTIPLAIYTAFNGAGVGQDTALALSLLIIVIAIGALVLVRQKHAPVLQ